MQIKNIKINQYGNIENKELNLEKFNIIYGKNESGKSTLLNYIMSSFYGISKNKKGNFESDYDKYKPWNNEEFSGNLSYVLDNGDEFNVFRNFDKKNPQLIDKMGIDVTKNYSADKKNGIQFIEDQINVDRDLMENTVISEQKHVELDNTTQNQLLQKIANLAESGDEEVSYKQATLKIDKMLLNEVGTERSQEKPINIAKNNINKLKNEINEIKYFENDRERIESSKIRIDKQLKEEEENKIIYENVKKIVDRNNFENEKIIAKKNILEENKKKINEKQRVKDELNKNKKTKFNAIILVILVIVSILSFVFSKSLVIGMSVSTIEPLFLLYWFFSNKKNSDNSIVNQIKVIEKNNQELEEEIKEMENSLKEKNEIEKNELVNRYGNNVEELFNNGINEIIKDNMEMLSNLKLERHKLDIDSKQIDEKFEKLAQDEEMLEIESENLKKLEEKAEIFAIAKEILSDSYNEMKSSVTPKFNMILSKNIEKFSNGKYKSISIDDGLFVVLENGERVPIEKLSTGTMEQIYLALRLSVMDEISKEKLPVILDEAFAYYDEDRLEETLKFLYELDNQVIILTCTDREKNVLEKNGVDYNQIIL